ncbi:hypothetical protein K461DRAFT_179164 [Myriangium duriaei CBS 260.36]|uniref:Uncharacterized protein n=1 Tax=Myriangium duriaei CBS 260.36 TaxID=1168546 RepID=A0A9P4IZE0_9PEZI|nr:hypothetical protein K461DRAFT_179164 [Myriangium duriaei CBS 260.36]
MSQRDVQAPMPAASNFDHFGEGWWGLFFLRLPYLDPCNLDSYSPPQKASCDLLSLYSATPTSQYSGSFVNATWTLHFATSHPTVAEYGAAQYHLQCYAVVKSFCRSARATNQMRNEERTFVCCNSPHTSAGRLISRYPGIVVRPVVLPKRGAPQLTVQPTHLVAHDSRREVSFVLC